MANYGYNPIVFPENDFSCRSSSDVVSVRSVGHPSDISISLFGSIGFKGSKIQFSSNVGNYGGNFSSFVITPPGVATFYTQPNYGGLSICLKPIPGYPTHVTWDITSLGLEAGQIKSMKFGCDSSNITFCQLY